jgi:hypothetical protein
MFRNVVLVLLLVGAVASATRADSIVLWEHFGGAGYGEMEGYYIPPEDRWVQCTLSGCGTIFGDDVYWYESDVPAEHIWPDANTPAGVWDAFVACITDENADLVYTCCASVIGGWCSDGHPYLAGCTIDYVRLYVESISYDGEPPDVSFSCMARWEIWGVPEPGSLLLLALGAALAGRCWRFGRVAA